MLNFFNSLQNRGKGFPSFPAWTYVQDGLQRETHNVIKAYQNSAYAVKTDHELVKILFGLATSTDMELNDYYRRVDAKTMNLAQQLGYTTVANQGRLFNGVFFAKGSREIILAHNTNFDPRAIHENWKYAYPVKVIQHGFDQLDFFPFNGTVKSNRLSVFTINIPMLAVQYRAFRQWQKENGQRDDGTTSSIYHFIYSYVLNNIQWSSVPLAIVNRVKKITVGKETNGQLFRHPFMVTDYSFKCDQVLKQYSWVIQNNNIDMASILYNMPMPRDVNGLEIMRLPDLYASRQVNWAVYAARIDILIFLTEVCLDTLKKTNQTELNRIKYLLGLFLRDNTIRQAMPPDLYYQEKAAIDELTAKL